MILVETVGEALLPPPLPFTEGANRPVSVRFLPEDIQYPGFKLSAIFCKQLFLGKSPENTCDRMCHGLREWNS